MTTRPPPGDINSRLTHRGVLFSITRQAQGDEPPAYRWMVSAVPPGHPEGHSVPDQGLVEGPRAFARAYQAAVTAIDSLLDASGPPPLPG